MLVELGDIKAMIAALHFMLCNAAKYDCEEKVFSLELQQLGLPKGTNVFRFLHHSTISRIVWTFS